MQTYQREYFDANVANTAAKFVVFVSDCFLSLLTGLGGCNGEHVRTGEISELLWRGGFIHVLYEIVIVARH